MSPNIAGANEYWNVSASNTVRTRSRTDRRRPLVWGEVWPRQALQMDEAEAQAQYVSPNESVEEIAAPIADDYCCCFFLLVWGVLGLITV